MVKYLDQSLKAGLPNLIVLSLGLSEELRLVPSRIQEKKQAPKESR
jgi:hypothetical protein